MNTDLKFQMRLIQWSRYLAVVIILIASLVLVGWWFDINELKQPFTSLLTMHPVTAGFFLLAGLSFFFLNRSLSNANLPKKKTGTKRSRFITADCSYENILRTI